MKKNITNHQLVFLLFLTMTAITITTIPKIIAEKAGVGGWLTILLTAITFALISLIITKLNTKYEGKVLFEYSQDIVGKFLTYLFAIFYALYFGIFTVYLIISIAMFIKSNFMVETPIWATMLISLSVCGYGAYKGITNIARLLELYGIVFLIGILLVHTIMFFQGNINYIKPFFIPSETGKYIGAMKDIILPFLGIEILTVVPFNAKNGKKAILTAFLTVIGIGLIYIIATESSIMMIGMYEIVHYKDATITAIRLVELKDIEFLRRVDILYLLIGFMSIHAGIMMAYTSHVEYTHKMLPKIKRPVIVIGFGIVAYIACLIFSDINNFMDVFDKYGKYLGIIAAFLIPLTLLIGSKVKKNESK